MTINEEIEKALSRELEGKVFEHVWITNAGGTFLCSKDFYTVINGCVYFISKDGELQITNDTMLSIKSQSSFIGEYDPHCKYAGTQNVFRQEELKKLLNL